MKYLEYIFILLQVIIGIVDLMIGIEHNSIIALLLGLLFLHLAKEDCMDIRKY